MGPLGLESRTLKTRAATLPGLLSLAPGTNDTGRSVHKIGRIWLLRVRTTRHS